MREIKFRAWDTKNKVMFTTVGIFECGDGEVTTYWGSYYLMDCDKEDLEIMQYTGLKDKNGKEIYEGDVINCLDTDTKFGKRYKKMKVDFYNGEFGIGDNWGHLGLKHLTEIEIIGNIYENQELLSSN